MKQYKYKVNQAEYDVTIKSITGNKASVEVNGIPFEVEMQGSSLVEDNLPSSISDVQEQPTAPAAQAENATEIARPAESAAPGAGTPVKAPLPGVVTSVPVKIGQSVKKGETVIVLEAMKMENNITAEADGKITGVCVAQGDSVMEGAVLVTIG